MKKQQEMVRQCMMVAEQECPHKPTMPPLDTRKLRVRLIAEELCELATAFGLEFSVSITGEIYVRENLSLVPNLVEAYDANLDIEVTSIGTAVAMGLDLEPGFDEVHRSNLSKFIGGVLKSPTGKFLKGPHYMPPSLAPIIEAQLVRDDNQMVIGI
jgi:predicted HAD superfamily Cof-like phosphohydrolase